MTLRIIGALLLVAGCGGMGFSLVRMHHREVSQLRSLKKALQEMEWELKYRVTPLPELCRVGGFAARGAVGEVLNTLAQRLDGADVRDVSRCMNALVSGFPLCRRVRQCLCLLGESLGRFDLQGQVEGLREAHAQCLRELEELKEGGSQRLRTYQTLGVCAGAALAILLL